MTKKQEGFSSRYYVPPHQWLKNCRENCPSELRVKCEKCGHFGHYVVHKGGLKSGKKVGAFKVMHSHFIEDVKIGRNKFCLYYYVPLKDNDLEWDWFVNTEAQERIIKQESEKMRKSVTLDGIIAVGAKK